MCVASLLVVAGCDHAPKPIVDLGSDWSCLSYPTAFRPSGTVFQVDKRTGAQRTFQDFSSVVAGTVRESPFVDVSATRSNQANAGVIASLIGLPIKAQADLRRTYSVSQSFGGASQTDVDQPTAFRLTSAFQASAGLAEAVRLGQAADNTYYLVRNTIRATEVTYSFDRDISADIDVGVTPATVGTVEAKAGLSDRTGTKYQKTFKEPQIVCVQADVLTVSRGSGSPLTPFAAPERPWSSGPGDQPLFRP